MSKILIVIIVLVAVFGAFTFLMNKNSSTPSSTTPSAMETNSQVANVILGDSGFVPKDIIVKAGTKVVWTNSSGKTATVDSADHPTHRLNTFLNLGEFLNNSFLQVVFDKAGKYNYHNHLNASETGTVTVE